jgi:Ca-activated chloride channel family protein
MHTKLFLDTDIIAIESEDKVTLMVDLTAPAAPSQSSRPARGVQICLDVSGSMEGAPLAAAKESILKLIDRLDKKDTFGLVIFDDTAKVAVPTKSLNDHNIADLKKAIRKIQTGGSTDISAGFTLAMREASRTKLEGGSTVLLISDGHANAGEQNPQFFSDVAAKSATEKISSASIGLGNGYDETILEAIAQGGGGAHRFAADIDEAVGAIAAEVEDLLDKVVVNCALRFRPTAMAKGQPKIELLQRLPYWMDGQDYVVQLGDLYAGENRRFIILVDVPGIADLGLCKIADVTIEYTDLAARNEVSVTMPVNVNVVPGDQAAGRIEDPIVKAERMILQAQSEKAIATEEILQGKSKSATKRLKGTAANLRTQASEIRVVDERSAESLAIILEEAAEMDALAQTAEHEDLTFSSKRMYESYSRKTRSKNIRPNQDSDESTNPDFTN